MELLEKLVQEIKSLRKNEKELKMIMCGMLDEIRELKEFKTMMEKLLKNE
jgi:hypothetical protein